VLSPPFTFVFPLAECLAVGAITKPILLFALDVIGGWAIRIRAATYLAEKLEDRERE
jgi:hypothetical protein